MENHEVYSAVLVDFKEEKPVKMLGNYLEVLRSGYVSTYCNRYMG